MCSYNSKDDLLLIFIIRDYYKQYTGQGHRMAYLSPPAMAGVPVLGERPHKINETPVFRLKHHCTVKHGVSKKSLSRDARADTMSGTL